MKKSFDIVTRIRNKDGLWLKMRMGIQPVWVKNQSQSDCFGRPHCDDTYNLRRARQAVKGQGVEEVECKLYRRS